MSHSTCIVLGASGFIGRHVCRELAARDVAVVGLGHGTWPEEEWRAWGLSSWLAADIGYESLARLSLPSAPRCIVHCGGSSTVSYSYAHPLQDFQRATQSTAEVLEWARVNAKGCRLVLVSSASVYGDQGDIDATENSVRSPISPYAFHKVLAESICDSYSRFFSVPISIVRLFSVYAEWLGKQLLWDALHKFRNGNNEFFGSGNELRDWIHVEDAARLLASAGLSVQSNFEIYNGGFEHASTRDILTRLSSAYGGDRPIVFTGQTHTGNPRRLTAECGHARRLLNWTPSVHLEEGLKRYADWFRAQHDAAPRHPAPPPHV